MKMEQNVLKHQNIKFRHRGINEKKDSTMLSFPRRGRVKNWIKVALAWGICGSLLMISSIFTGISQ